VARLLGADEKPNVVDERLAALAKAEVVEQGPNERFPSAECWMFRHDLLRDAAYATFTDADRANAHRLAVGWLERAGERDAVVLADHCERAGDAGKAIKWLTRASEVASSAASFGDAIQLVERALACGAAGSQRGGLRVTQAIAAVFLRDWAKVQEAAADAFLLVEPGSTAWFHVVAAQVFASASTGDMATVADLTSRVRAIKQQPDPTGPYAFAMFGLVSMLSLSDQLDVAKELLQRLDARRQVPFSDFGFMAWRALARTHMALNVNGSPGLALKHVAEAMRLAPGLGDAVFQVVADYYHAAALIEVGDWAGAERAAMKVLGDHHAAGVPYIRDWAAHIIARAALLSRRTDDAIALGEKLRRSPDALIVQRGGSLLALAFLASGRNEEAERVAIEVRAASLGLHDVKVVVCVLARTLLARGRPAEALSRIEEAFEIERRCGAAPTSSSQMRQVHVEVLRATDGPWKPALIAARERVLRLAQAIAVPEHRRTWLTGVVENTRTLALADELLGPLEAPTGEHERGAMIDEDTGAMAPFGPASPDSPDASFDDEPTIGFDE
jgi:tetratricopeptide (TPR) repeat protein